MHIYESPLSQRLISNKFSIEAWIALKVSKKYSTLLLATFMTLAMDLAMTFTMVAVMTGFTSSFLERFIGGFAIGFVVGLPTSLIVIRLVKGFIDRITY